ncbi:MAG: hypothetical protein ACT4PZ_03810 [Panacagrimonas sp.]
MNLKTLIAGAALTLAVLPGSASAGGIDIRIGVGNPGVVYHDRAPGYRYDRRPVYYYDRYRPEPTYRYYGRPVVVYQDDQRNDRYWRSDARWDGRRDHHDRSRHHHCDD